MPAKKPTDPNESRRGMFVAHGECRIVASADAAGAAGKPKRLEIVGYTGDAIRQWWNKYPMVVDLAGMKTGSVPIVLNHDTFSFDSIVGQADKVVNDGRQLLLGTDIVGEGEEVQKFVRLSEKGVQFQASIGADLDPKRIDFVAEGQRVVVNGREFTGPLNVVRASTLRETSVLILGADAGTSAAIAALAMMEGSTMPNGNSQTPDPAGTPAQQSVAAGNSPVTPPAAQTPAPAATPAVQAGNQPAAPAAPTGPLGIVAGTDGASSTHPQIDYTLLAKAIVDQGGGEGVLQSIRAGRPQAPMAHVPTHNVEASDQVLIAAMCIAGKLPDIETHFDEKTLEAAHKRRNMGLQEMLIRAAKANGFDRDVYAIKGEGVLREVLEYAFPQRGIKASATHDIGNVTGAIYGKFLLNGFMAVENVCDRISLVRPVSDFKQVTGIRVGGGFEFQEVGNDGELKSADAKDSARSFGAKTYGRISTITRKDIINDDLGALTVIPMRLGRGAAIARNKVFWKEFLASNSSYFAGASPDASNALSIASLEAAQVGFEKQTDPDNNPLGVQAAIVLVPLDLKTQARKIMSSSLLISGETKLQASQNVLAGAYEVVASAYLTNAGASSTWWLCSNPGDLNAMEMVYLDGNPNPVIESAQADFDVLGIAVRGFHDFGVAKGESRAAYRMATV